jgi:hypothetical protein
MAMRLSAFLRLRRIRHPQTPKTYRRVLWGFQDVVLRLKGSSAEVMDPRRAGRVSVRANRSRAEEIEGLL